jgi:hypothetical protein
MSFAGEGKEATHISSIASRVARRGRILALCADFLKRGVGRLDLSAALHHKTNIR